MPEETGETLCETRENVRGNGGNTWGIAAYIPGFLGHLVTSFHVKTEQPDGKTHEYWGLSIVFPHIFPCEGTRILSTKQNGRARQWMYIWLPGFIPRYT